MRLRFAMIEWDPGLSGRGRGLPKGLARVPTLVCNGRGRCTDMTGVKHDSCAERLNVRDVNAAIGTLLVPARWRSRRSSSDTWADKQHAFL
jgi:hypothetical protein